jgi:hypothetical protein
MNCPGNRSTWSLYQESADKDASNKWPIFPDGMILTKDYRLLIIKLPLKDVICRRQTVRHIIGSVQQLITVDRAT